jgi:hypothetical protein
VLDDAGTPKLDLLRFVCGYPVRATRGRALRQKSRSSTRVYAFAFSLSQRQQMLLRPEAFERSGAERLER